MDLKDDVAEHADYCADRSHDEGPCESAQRTRHGVTARVVSELPTEQGLLPEQSVWLSCPGRWLSRGQLSELLDAGRDLLDEITRPAPRKRRPA